MNPPLDPRRDALSSVGDVLKVLTGLASGVIVFSYSIVSASATGYSWWLPAIAVLALVFLVTSLGLGLFTQGYIPKQVNSGNYNINDPSLRNSALFAILSFFFGILLLAIVIAITSLFPVTAGKTTVKVPSADVAVLIARQAVLTSGAATLVSVNLLRGADEGAERKNLEWHVRFDLPDSNGNLTKQADVFLGAADARSRVFISAVRASLH